MIDFQHTPSSLIVLYNWVTAVTLPRQRNPSPW